ncbi:MAG: hypothetical protein HONBIEJF_02354 [Fimbriimonadaceae bacterium]|nr:hypothetical protein [Fimbriimonadaceae bacterium]
MGIVVRRYREDDRETYAQVHGDVYRDGTPLRPDEAIEKEGDMLAFVAECDGEVVGGYRQLEATFSWNGQGLWGAGIAGVAVSPAARRQGVGAALMEDSVRQMKDEGRVLAALYPFRSSFYQRFGYENCGCKLKITCPQHRMPRGDESFDSRRLTIADVEELDACHKRHAARYNGIWLRTHIQWAEELASPRRIFGIGKPVKGYLFFDKDAGFWVPGNLGELVWDSAEAYEGLLGLMRSVAINKSALSWNEPSDSPFVASYLEQGVAVEVERPVMYRLLDVVAGLSRLRTDRQLSFCFQVHDHNLPENSGEWRVESGPDRCEVTRGGSPDFRLDIRRLTQAFMGEPALDQLLGQGAVEVLNPPGARSAVEALPHRPVYCIDQF